MASRLPFRNVIAARGAFLLLSASIVWAQQTPPRAHGVPVRATPGDYPVHLHLNGVTYAASVVPANEVKHTFAFDITKRYVVFEVALYTDAGSHVQLDPGGFVVRIPRSGDIAHNADSVTVASVIQQENIPKPASRVGPVVASTEVGYESGRDPYTGQRVHGTYTATQVGVGAGNDPGPPRYPSPGGYPQDRALLESQLWDKSLPEGDIQRPTAGYLYFPASLLKKKSDNVYELQYLGPQDQPQLANAPARVELRVPAKTR
jgi:hypothetical protein